MVVWDFGTVMNAVMPKLFLDTVGKPTLIEAVTELICDDPMLRIDDGVGIDHNNRGAEVEVSVSGVLVDPPSLDRAVVSQAQRRPGREDRPRGNGKNDS